ncbi:hypothetical protein FACS1894124_6330 [Spirochaetia bacterium]|nr:hypothetical protein FACS1894124_6330 [Spirochaetia bacterium]
MPAFLWNATFRRNATFHGDATFHRNATFRRDAMFHRNATPDGAVRCPDGNGGRLCPGRGSCPKRRRGTGRTGHGKAYYPG